jgi:hypothetical protein
MDFVCVKYMDCSFVKYGLFICEIWTVYLWNCVKYMDCSFVKYMDC